MTKSKGIGKGKGGGRPAKEQKRLIIPIAINADRVKIYKEYLSVKDGGRIVEDRDVLEWVRSHLYGIVAQLDEMTEREAERTMVI